MSDQQPPQYPQFPSAPPPPETYAPDLGPRPRELTPVIALLIANLVLSCVLTVVAISLRHSVVNYQLDHRHISDPAERDTLRTGLQAAIWSRVVANLVVSIVYTFIVRALLAGKRWAYRRVIILSIAGMVGLLSVYFTPYPTWWRAEQTAQALVLIGLLYCVTRPAVRDFCVVPGGRWGGRGRGQR